MKKLAVIAVLVVLALLVYADRFLPAQIERGMNVNLPHEPYSISDAARALHETLFVADLHTDSLLWKRDLRKRAEHGHMDLPRMRDGNIALQVFSATTKSPAGQNYERNEDASDRITLLAIAQFWPPRTWTSIYERAVYQLDKLKDLAATGEVVLLLDRNDVRELAARRQRGEKVIGAVYLTEGGHPFEGDIAKVDALFEEGLRITGLTHFFDNELGGSLHGISGDGLTEFGRAVVRRADELGLILDVAHASPRMVAEVLELSDRPVVLSHGGIKGVCDTARNLSDELMRDVAAHGGLVGIGFWDAAVCDVTPDGVVAAIRYAIDLLGEEHVALGSDYDGSTAVTFDASELAVLTDAMLRAGFTEQEIRLVMGENIRRFLLENLPEG
ncbi:MAG: membrane dipeptidase [Gammaproteobacteria bacterium]|nr:membrane dipeptidase [Gammaproteobacteria bacterium]MDH4256559.1 membrane dipeptidase [Gammaproteobacteria bacterium]MDH5312076.1 membrane dipeptidase [Gammaproteobacteria bacterium]